MTDKEFAMLALAPLIVAMAVVLWRKGAISGGVVGLVTIAAGIIASVVALT
ncbi:hypothetical protein [Caenispirillum salinarum]|uniref:hypothetical protein n=1 Tax=Caenispirillum salinarum TaxID=859058 RepID=UPI00384DB9FD